MYLKSIEVHGFKSFANKIVLEFHDGITGIVGPNGSGKSNVADAVRWVLGEQSAKQLRGSRMEDVIFSGTQTRKPLGYAYVALTMDNSDHKLPIEFDEVIVARRVYRSGESEYLINGATCRLRDVQELFLDTGIGKEGYSIIGQGQIDKILSGKPEDRRELFDEAAGIVKFKRRKYAAEKNLEEEKLNLARITDITKEIEKQLDPLEKQSATAKIYLKLKEELKGLEVNQFLKEYDKLRSSKEQVEEKLSIASADLAQATKEYENTKEEYVRLEGQLEECDQRIEEDKNTYNELKLEKEKAEGEIKVLKEQISSMLKNDEYYQGRIRSNEQDIESKKAEEQRYLSEKASIDSKISDMDDLLTAAMEDLNRIKANIIRFTKEIEECNNGIFEFLNANSGIKSSMQRYETMLEQNTLRKSELNQRILKNKSEESLYNESIEKCKEELKRISEDILKQTEENKSLEKAVSDTQAVIDSLTMEANEVQGRFLSERSRLESLVNLTERYEGYGNSIKKVMERKPNLPGIIGVVADIIKTEKTYETAIETALGGTIQNIVTDNETTAKELISYLKTNKYGRATFLPLTNIKSGSNYHNDKVLKEEGVIGVASSLVENDSKFNNLMDYLLGRIYVVDHIDHATSIAKKYNYTLRIVTLEGELLTPGGSISGGAYKNASNLLGRRREIEEMEEQVAALEKRSKDLLRRKEEAREKRANLRQSIEEIKLILQNLFLGQNTAKMNLDRETAKKAEAEAIYQEYTKELQEIEIQAKDLKENLLNLNINLTENLEKNKEKEESIEILNKALEEEREKERLAGEKASTLKLELSSLEQSNQFLLENVKRIKRDIERLYEEEAALKADIQRTNQIVAEKKLIITNKEEDIRAFNKSITELDEKIKAQVENREQITKIHKNFFTKREELSNRMNELDKEAFRLNSQRDKLLEQADQQMNYMWEEYELTYTTALTYPIDTEISLTQIKKSISEIKVKIKELGDVNVNAIEDYKNLSERYEFLTNQREDLIRAEEALLQIIHELDTEMRRQFEEKFAAIKEQFDIVFKELFGGGKADLELTEVEDILEAGIRINAQPPGKKLQNMMQLSGGEKALTAISLLFAIQNLKPSPFCLLDEIEAALDDSNVKRFAKYLNKLTKDTQFIIITHRRGTMAAADILYGITMQEKGISTLVSVSLIENELDK
ncbi:chromosome segregation protein SMC [Mobilitalea sibirica]|uniref:Chromosome partition protein Smc n=1 Tax=Mobilitalea sibirica TaxID=1462919 RepID=A0A8J7KXX9_9FIRM|nr:chromosome segregation protein SMC [Mobilitalea sibirica]MBH1942387.1 chromosome segregation protein SMC [Mobilitalea sibirica]